MTESLSSDINRASLKQAWHWLQPTRQIELNPAIWTDAQGLIHPLHKEGGAAQVADHVTGLSDGGNQK